MSHQFSNLCYHMEKICDIGGCLGRNVWGEMSGVGNVWVKMSGGQCLGDNVWETMSGRQCLGDNVWGTMSGGQCLGDNVWQENVWGKMSGGKCPGGKCRVGGGGGWKECREPEN